MDMRTLVFIGTRQAENSCSHGAPLETGRANSGRRTACGCTMLMSSSPTERIIVFKSLTRTDGSLNSGRTSSHRAMWLFATMSCSSPKGSERGRNRRSARSRSGRLQGSDSQNGHTRPLDPDIPSGLTTKDRSISGRRSRAIESSSTGESRRSCRGRSGHAPGRRYGRRRMSSRRASAPARAPLACHEGHQGW